MSTDKARVAFFDFAGCEGCQLTVLDALQTHLELLDAIEIMQFREAMSEREDNFQIAFVEGSCVWPSDPDRLKQIRAQAEVVVALGACAHLGGVNAIRNAVEPEEAARVVYHEMASKYQTDAALPIDAVIPVDAYLPGCPIDRTEFIHALTSLLQGTLPSLQEDPVCVECKLAENQCLLLQGKICMGPITRAGCGAICPAFGVGCEGCRGMLPDANLDSLRQIMLEHGLNPETLQRKLSLFLSHPLSQISKDA
jgi:sulfhydrogenase subunit delta